MSKVDETAKPTPEAVTREMSRIRGIFEYRGDEDHEDLISYAKEVVRLRSRTATPSEGGDGALREAAQALVNKLTGVSDEYADELATLCAALALPAAAGWQTMDTVYVVGATVGEWSDRSEWTVGVWVNEADAQAFVKAIDALGREYEKVSPERYDSEECEAIAERAAAACTALDKGWSDYCGDAPRYTCWPEKLIRPSPTSKTGGDPASTGNGGDNG